MGGPQAHGNSLGAFRLLSRKCLPLALAMWKAWRLARVRSDSLQERVLANRYCVVVVIVAALNLVLDFDLIESGARAGAPKYMEWYGGFALMVTLIWLYFEILRLLSKIRSRD